jgi:hypothetical protein
MEGVESRAAEPGAASTALTLAFIHLVFFTTDETDMFADNFIKEV